MISFLIIAFIFLTSFLILITTIAFLRARDIFTMTHVVMIFNCYILPLTLIAIEIKNFSSTSILKIITLTLINIVIVNIVCHLILRRAMINKIYPDAETKKSK
jgi:multisubunit Na+/H+ antiporter MnhG subunit